ncbi:Os03g0823900 [Oryza sativa Japonica Group]|uniref:Os03g0823900 protein n=2 Tax=Oryza sativa subsp. japonica TaxID=39947 RepID=Q0DM78_ORYSJ|nr:calmodulin-binding protein, putative [Oryza sativa Japonica Group]BAF13660.1 Os03g0823900 [Oryza sativa Japonica Group]|eukprot:NP_001051746.1 Os03g0823900 [Oryza sativa Japonica Group]
MSQKRQLEESSGSRAEAWGPLAQPNLGLGARRRPTATGSPSIRWMITEVMQKSSIEKLFMAIEPLIRRMVKEEIESAFANHAIMMARTVMDVVPPTSKNFQLQFMTKLSLPIFTSSKIEGESSLSITIALVDTVTREVVASGDESLMKVEIVVLEGDFEDDSAIQQNIWIYWPSYSQTMQILGSGMSTKMWEVTVEHSKTCILTDKVHLYYPHSLIKTAVVFNVVGEVRGLISEKFVCADDLMEKDKAEAHAAVKQAYENWKNVSTDGFGLSQSSIPSADIGSLSTGNCRKQ